MQRNGDGTLQVRTEWLGFGVLGRFPPVLSAVSCLQLFWVNNFDLRIELGASLVGQDESWVGQ